MKIIITVLIFVISLTQSAFSFGMPLTFEDLCKQADLIVKVSIVKVIKLEDKVVDGFTIPSKLSLVKVMEVYKGSKQTVGTNIYMPILNRWDPAPIEVKEENEYVLFLSSMSMNYYYPMDHNSVYLITGKNVNYHSKGQVAITDFIKEIAKHNQATPAKAPKP